MEGSSATVPVVVTADPMTFKAVVPVSLPVAVTADGTVVTATNATVTNSSSLGMIRVKSITVTGIGDWTLTDFSSDFAHMSVDSKAFGLSVDDNAADNSTGSIVVSGIPAMNITQAETLSYTMKIAPQVSGLTDESVANVVVVIGWNT